MKNFYLHISWKYTNAQLPLGYSLTPSFPCQGADAAKDDGVYSRYFTAYDTNGRYSVKVWALGGINAATQRLIPQQNGAMYIPGWIENGKKFIITYLA